MSTNTSEKHRELHELGWRSLSKSIKWLVKKVHY